MNIVKEAPTLARISNSTSEEIQILRELCKYKNTSIDFVLRKHKKNRWWRSRDLDGWNQRLNELTSQVNSCLLHEDSKGFYVKSGYVPYIQHLFKNITDNIIYPNSKPLSWKIKPIYSPYPYQTEAVSKLIAEKHGNIELPTGCGKSFILLMIAKELGLKTVIVTPGKSIFNELLNEFQKRLGKAYVGGYGDGKKDTKKLITIAIGKSLTMLKEGSKEEQFFKNKEVMLVDEAHTFAADQLEKVCHGVLASIPYRMFVSATQTRGDGTEKMLHSIIGKTVMSMSLQEAIKDGYLCPLKFIIKEVISPSRAVKKDPLECKRTHFLYNEEIAKTAAQIANSAAENKNQSTLILVEELKQIQMLSKHLKAPYAYVHSASKAKAAEFGLETVKLQDQVDLFNEGKVKVLIGTRCISTGTNMYPTHFTVNFMGGASEIITKQGPMGRSTRKLEISEFADKHSEKPYSTIIDFNVLNQDTLSNHLIKRIKYYKEAGGDIEYY